MYYFAEMILSYQILSNPRLFVLLFLLIILGYSPRVGWESGSVWLQWVVVQRRRAGGLRIIYFYMMDVISDVECPIAVALFIITMNVIMRDTVVRLFVLRVLVSFVVPFCDYLWCTETDIVYEYSYDHAHCRLLYLCDIIFYPCAVRCFRFLESVLIKIHDSSTRTTLLSFGARLAQVYRLFCGTDGEGSSQKS